MNCFGLSGFGSSAASDETIPKTQTIKIAKLASFIPQSVLSHGYAASRFGAPGFGLLSISDKGYRMRACSAPFTEQILQTFFARSLPVAKCGELVLGTIFKAIFRKLKRTPDICLMASSASSLRPRSNLTKGVSQGSLPGRTTKNVLASSSLGITQESA